MKSVISVVLVTIFVLFQETEARVRIETRLRECSNGGQKFDSCLIQLMEDIRPFLKEGIPELNVPVLEPIYWDKLDFTQRNGSIEIVAQFTDVFVHGFSNFTLKNLRVVSERNELQIRISIPLLDVVGNYVLNGKVIFLKINGTGPFTSNIRDIDAGLASEIVIKKDGGKERLGVDNTRINFRVGRARSDLRNLFNGDPILGEIANHFLNTNDQMILNELKPFLSESLAQLVQGVMDSAMATLPLNALPKHPKSSA